MLTKFQRSNKLSGRAQALRSIVRVPAGSCSIGHETYFSVRGLKALRRKSVTESLSEYENVVAAGNVTRIGPWTSRSEQQY